jgi:hypothetical protein
MQEHARDSMSTARRCAVELATGAECSVIGFGFGVRLGLVAAAGAVVATAIGAGESKRDG